MACALKLPNEAITVAVPRLNAVICGGSSEESVTAAELSTVQVAPVTPLPFWSTSERVLPLPTSIAAEDGVRVNDVTLETVKFTPLLTRFAAVVTTTFPVVAVCGTVAVMLVLLQFMIVALTPLKVTPLTTFWVCPKPFPVMVTEVPTDPMAGCRLRILGRT